MFPSNKHSIEWMLMPDSSLRFIKSQLNWLNSLPALVEARMEPKCTLPMRNHCRHQTETVVDYPNDSHQWLPDVHETDWDESSGAGFDVSELSSDSIVGLLHAPPEFDKEEFVFLASHCLIESCLDCSSLVDFVAVVKTSMDRVSLYSVADDVKEIEMKSLQSH